MQPASPYDLKRAVAMGVRQFWSLPHTQLYSECARLAEAGLLLERREESGGRRRIYRLTKAGGGGARPLAGRADQRALRAAGCRALLEALLQRRRGKLAPRQLEGPREPSSREYEAQLERMPRGSNAPEGIIHADREPASATNASTSAFWKRLGR